MTDKMKLEEKVHDLYIKLHKWSEGFTYSEYDFRLGQYVLKIRAHPIPEFGNQQEVILILNKALAYKDYPFGGLTSKQDRVILDYWTNKIRTMNENELLSWVKQNQNNIIFPEGRLKIVGGKYYGRQYYGDEWEPYDNAVR